MRAMEGKGGNSHGVRKNSYIICYLRVNGGRKIIS